MTGQSTGMNRHTGAAISGTAQLVQDINDLLSTPRGTRLMRRDYGSDVPELIDKPQNRETAMLLVAATAGAVNRWIRRIRVLRCQPVFGADAQNRGRGALTLDFIATDTLNASQQSLTIAL